MTIKNGTKSSLKIIPLGGLHEIGKNTCVLEYKDEIIIVDGGIAFPTDEMHGINIVLPDMTYLRENRHKIKAMIVTHGHEDHIGGISYHLKQFDIPVTYGPRLALALLGDKLEEAGVEDRTILKAVLPREKVKVSPSFEVEFIRNTHSIADSFTIAIHTPLGIIIHTGDFKIDHTPVDGEHFDLQKLAEYGEKGVLCLLSDSTNAEVPGHTPSESSVYPSLDRVFSQTKGRLMLTTFASSVHRIKLVLDLAQKYNRKVVVVGRSMLNVIAHARNLKYIQCPDNLFEPLKALRFLPDEKVLILTTGSQGEPLAALTRIARGEHRDVKIRPGDTVVFSANPIPGNTIAVVNTIDSLMMQGANVIYGRDKGIHVSGHGAQEDHKLMIALTKPKFFVPVHGEHRMLVKHAQTAQSMGIPAENMVIINNGDIVELTADSIKKAGQVPSGIELVDQAGVVHETVMKERQQLAEEGVLTVAVALDRNGKLLTRPEIHLRGVVTTVERSLLQQLVIREIDRFLGERCSNFGSSGGDAVRIDPTGLRLDLEASLDRLVRRELRTNPLIVVLLQTSEPVETVAVETVTINPPTNSNSSAITKPNLSTKFPRRRKRSTASVAS